MGTGAEREVGLEVMGAGDGTEDGQAQGEVLRPKQLGGETGRGRRCRAGAAGQRRGGKRDPQDPSQDGGQPDSGGG